MLDSMTVSTGLYKLNMEFINSLINKYTWHYQNNTIVNSFTFMLFLRFLIPGICLCDVNTKATANKSDLVWHNSLSLLTLFL